MRRVHHKTVAKKTRPVKKSKLTRRAQIVASTSRSERDSSTEEIWHKRELAVFEMADIDVRLKELAQKVAVLQLRRSSLDAAVEGFTQVIDLR
ncbi:MAG: hypothetical protein JW395_2589 [Nitrospira sp.]|nr:hypothetical protein [Nitrospira sp.]